MKYCSKCGNELLDDAVICPKCGCAVEGMRNPETVDNRSGLQTAAKIFMIIGCIAIGWCLIPLAWCIPMTVSYFGKTERGERVSTGFKICTLLFVNMIAGILMLCDDAN